MKNQTESNIEQQIKQQEKEEIVRRVITLEAENELLKDILYKLLKIEQGNNYMEGSD